MIAIVFMVWYNHTMNTLRILRKYHISTASRYWAVEDAGIIGIGAQRKLIKELFGKFKYELPNKNYLITMTLKLLVRDIVRDQQTVPFDSIKPYKKAVNAAKKHGKESIYARFVLSTQKARRKKRTQKTTSSSKSGATV